MKYFIKTFGCAANIADSERLAGFYQSRGYKPAKGYSDANVIVINTCVVRQQAEDRVYGLVENLAPLKAKNPNLKIVVTGCLVGAAVREPTGAIMKKMRQRLPAVDEFLPIEEVGFEYQAVRTDNSHAWVPISNGCNNFCTFCIVPFSRGREISRGFDEILAEVEHLALQGFREITLLGQNVNSYGADLILGPDNIQRIRDKNGKTYFDDKIQKSWNGEGFRLPNGRVVKPVMIKHLGRFRIPTLFPYLLEELCEISGIEKISFLSSNPWDFSDELIEVIARNRQISRDLHLPVQAGDNQVLRRMNRWYTREEYLDLVRQIKKDNEGHPYDFAVEMLRDKARYCLAAATITGDNSFRLAAIKFFEEAIDAVNNNDLVGMEAGIVENDFEQIAENYHVARSDDWEFLSNPDRARWMARTYFGESVKRLKFVDSLIALSDLVRIRKNPVKVTQDLIIGVVRSSTILSAPLNLVRRKTLPKGFNSESLKIS